MLAITIQSILPPIPREESNRKSSKFSQLLAIGNKGQASHHAANFLKRSSATLHRLSWNWTPIRIWKLKCLAPVVRKEGMTRILTTAIFGRSEEVYSTVIGIVVKPIAVTASTSGHRTIVNIRLFLVAGGWRHSWSPSLVVEDAFTH